MKKTVLMIAVLCAGLGLRAADSPSYSVTLDIPYTTKYMFRGVEVARGSIQPSVEIASGAFTAGVWANQPIADHADNEIDFYAGYSAPLAEKWSLDVGAAVYTYPETADETTWEPYVGITGEVGGVAPGLYLYYDLTLEVLTVEGQLGYSVPLESIGSSLDFGARLGRVDPKSGSGYTYCGVGASVPFKISQSGTVTVGVNYAHNNLSGVDHSHLFGTIGVSFGF